MRMHNKFRTIRFDTQLIYNVFKGIYNKPGAIELAFYLICNALKGIHDDLKRSCIY